MNAKFVFAGLIVLMVGACTSRGGLHDFRLKPGDGPDEFRVTTQKPLERPENELALPQPGAGPNRADLDPKGDAVAALGGNANRNGIPTSDGALVRHAGRYGVDGNIRNQLDEDDEKYRKRRGGFSGLRGSNRYYRVYAPMALDAQKEVDRFRGRGVRVPTAPPR